MGKLKGDGKVTVNASTTEKVVLDISDWSVDRSAGSNDESTFDDGDWAAKGYGKKSWGGSCSGFFADADTTGQDVLKAAFAAGTVINDIRFYMEYSVTAAASLEYIAPDTATDATAGIIITSLSIKKDHTNKTTSISFSFDGTGPVLETSTTVPA